MKYLKQTAGLINNSKLGPNTPQKPDHVDQIILEGKIIELKCRIQCRNQEMKGILRVN